MSEWGWTIVAVGAGLVIAKIIEGIFKRHGLRRRRELTRRINTPIYYKRAEDRDAENQKTDGIHTD